MPDMLERDRAAIRALGPAHERALLLRGISSQRDSVTGWNATHPLHPKGADGKWADTPGGGLLAKLGSLFGGGKPGTVKVEQTPAVPEPPVAPKPKPSLPPRPSARRSGLDLLADSSPRALGAQVQREIEPRLYHGRTPSGRKAMQGDGPNGDERIFALAQRQGFIAHPETVSSDQLDAQIADGWIEIHRGVANGGDGSATGAQIAEQFRSGDYVTGKGFWGNGFYFTELAAKAEGYATFGGRGGSTMRAALDPKANIASEGNFYRDHKNFLRELAEEVVGPEPPDAESSEHRDYEHRLFEARNADPVFSMWWDPGVYAAARGVDAVLHIDDERPAGYLGPPPFDYLVLNRTALMVEEAA